MTHTHSPSSRTRSLREVLMLPFLLLSLGVPEAMATTIRISTLQFQQNADNVHQLQQAITKMRALSTADPMSADFRTSFAYWSNTHGYFGTGTHATNKQQ